MGNLVTLEECRGEGIVAEDSRIEQIIEWAEAWLEKETGFRFFQHHAEFTLDGPRDSTLVLPQPIISVQSVDEGGTSLSSGDYAVYNRRPPSFDDRGFPRLVRRSSLSNFGDSGQVSTGAMNWLVGLQNIVVEGEFGYTDQVGGQEVPPADIKRAVLRLVAAEIGRVGNDADVQAQRARKYATDISSEHLSISLAQLAAEGGLSGIREVDDVVRRYRHPVSARRAPFAFGGA